MVFRSRSLLIVIAWPDSDRDLTGALYIRRRPRVRLEAQMSGGGQERGLRSGTLPHPLIVGFGAACRIAAEEMEHDHRCMPSSWHSL